MTPVAQTDIGARTRVLLWDIDGTIMRTGRVGAFKHYAVPVLESFFGTSGALAELNVSGMTDWQIVTQALAPAGISEAEICAQAEPLRAAYLSALERSTRAGHQSFALLPGVRELLEHTHRHANCHNALLTGNIEEAAYFKVAQVGVEDYFRLPGAFGSDAMDRNLLPRIAALRICAALGVKLEPRQFIVIGDTPNDIFCARAFGAKAIAVATGRNIERAELAQHNPDLLLDDLSDFTHIADILDSL